MAYANAPLIVQSDKTILLEAAHPAYDEARDSLLGFAELEKSPEHMHTYRITPLSLWNAAASGISADSIISSLESLSRYPLPGNVVRDIRECVARYGKLRLEKNRGQLVLTCEERALALEVWSYPQVQELLEQRLTDLEFSLSPHNRGRIKQVLTRLGYPVKDLAGYRAGDSLGISMRQDTASGEKFRLRRYQQSAVDAFWAHGSVHGGSGIIVLPCGAGKTIIGIGAMSKLKCETLILATNVVAVRQWIDEILDKCDIHRDMVGEYTGEVKQVCPVTVTTYQILTHRKRKHEEFPHFNIFSRKNWGLIIYDEVHLLPAPVFRVTADLQATRRLGLTATLVREDGCEEDVFSLIGPKRFDMPWKDLERQGWIASAVCREIRTSLDEDLKLEYAVADAKSKFRIASENPRKTEILKKLLSVHREDQVLIIGQYLEQLEAIAAEICCPLICGKTPNTERQRLYAEFKSGTVKTLVVSKVANFAIDLPDAGVLIQVSGTFGSRQEEAQRLGRILRPKKNGKPAVFYSIVTQETKDQDFAQKRQLFLTEQGYYYQIGCVDEILDADTGLPERSSTP